MANDVAKTLAAAASGPPDRAKVMEITLKLRADSGNAAVLKQLSDQVKEAAHKAIQEVEHLGEALVKKAHGWAKEMGESISKALEKAGEKAERKEAAEPTRAPAEKQPPAGREIQPHPEVSQPKSPPTSAASSRPQEPPDAKKTEATPAKDEKSTTEKVLGILHKGTSAGKHVQEAASSEKTVTERMAAGAEALEEGHDAIKGAKDLLDVLKKTAAAKEAVGAAGTVVQTATNAVGVGGTLATLGKGAVASVGGWGTIAGAAQVAGIGAVAVAGGVALHDGFKLLLNKVGFLGGNFDTLSGTVMDWNESTKRSAEIEKKIAETQEAHQKQLEQIQVNQQNARSVYEAKDRIEESKKFQQEAAELVPIGRRFGRRYGAIDPEHVGTERELQKRDQAYVSEDRRSMQDAYVDKFSQKEQEQHKAAEDAKTTADRNRALQYGRSPGSSGQAITTNVSSDKNQGSVQPGSVDKQEQLLQEERALKLANDLRGLARDRTIELGNQLATMEQQIRAAEHQVAAAREQVKAEQDKVNSQKAQLSMLSQGDQHNATNILKTFNHTKHLSRDHALTLQKMGITQGRIGKAINETLAQGLDPELAKQFKQAGGEEDLDKAQQHLKDSTQDLAQAQSDALETFQDFMETLGDFSDATDRATSAQIKFEKTKSEKEGYSDPTVGEREDTHAAVDKVKESIHAARADFVKAVKDLGEKTVETMKVFSAELNATAQQIKNAHK